MSVEPTDIGGSKTIPNHSKKYLWKIYKNKLYATIITVKFVNYILLIKYNNWKLLEAGKREEEGIETEGENHTNKERREAEKNEVNDI